MADALRLIDYDEILQKEYIDYTLGSDGKVHLRLPDDCRKYEEHQFKIKLYGLQECVAECNTWPGWGTQALKNPLEVISQVMEAKFLDYDNLEIKSDITAYCGWCDDWDFFASFTFSHCEYDVGDIEFTTIFICYTYNGITKA